MRQLKLEWPMFESGEIALVFDEPTWAAFERAAQDRGRETGAMIVASLAGLLGEPVLV
jgi:hypothetical protein